MLHKYPALNLFAADSYFYKLAADLLERERNHRKIIAVLLFSAPHIKFFFESLRNLVGAKLKMVHGYKGSADMKLALTRGEIQGMCGLPISTLKSFWRDAVEAGHDHDAKPLVARGPWTGVDEAYGDLTGAVRDLDAGAGGPSAALYNAIARNIGMRIVADRSRAAPGRYS